MKITHLTHKGGWGMGELPIGTDRPDPRHLRPGASPTLSARAGGLHLDKLNSARKAAGGVFQFP